MKQFQNFTRKSRIYKSWWETTLYCLRGFLKISNRREPSHQFWDNPHPVLASLLGADRQRDCAAIDQTLFAKPRIRCRFNRKSYFSQSSAVLTPGKPMSKGGWSVSLYCWVLLLGTLTCFGRSIESPKWVRLIKYGCLLTKYCLSQDSTAPLRVLSKFPCWKSRTLSP